MYELSWEKRVWKVLNATLLLVLELYTGSEIIISNCSKLVQHLSFERSELATYSHCSWLAFFEESHNSSCQ